MKKTRLSKPLALLLALIMIISLLPITAMADEPSSNVSSQYLSGISFDRTTSDSNQLYLKSNALPYETFSFDPATKEYDMMLVDSGSGDNLICFRVTPKAGTSFKGKFTDGISDESYNSNKLEKEYSAASSRNYIRTFGMAAWGLSTAGTCPKVISSSPTTRNFVVGTIVDGEYTETETYTFNFYRKATLESFAVAYENGTGITDGIPSTFDPYLNDYEVTGVTAGTDKLVITAPAKTPTDTTLKFDNGSGVFEEGSTADTFTLDLTKYTPDNDGSITIPFMLDYSGTGCGVDGYYTLTVSFAEDPNNVSSQYLSDIAFDRTLSDSNQLYLKSNALPYETFSFDPATKEYDMMLVESGSGDNLICFRVTPKADTSFKGKFTDGISDESYNSNKLEKEYSAASSRNYIRTFGMAAWGLSTAGTCPKVISSSPTTRNFVVGTIVDGEYTETETYTFNFYRKATLESFAVAYENGTGITDGIPSTFDPYLNDYEVTGVTAGTDKLVITAPAKTQTNTTLKVNDGSGVFKEGSTADTFTLDLTKYTPDNDGSITIPFMLDYDQNKGGCGVDGYYTLTVRFGEGDVDYTPVFTSVSEDAEVNIGDSLSLSVEVEALESDTELSLSYQWYSSDSDEGDGEGIDGATAAAYTPPTDSVGSTFYTCKATRTADDESYSATAGPIKVTVGEEQSGEGDLNGYVKNITFKTDADDYVIFDAFAQNEISYDGVVMPTARSVSADYNILVELADPDPDSISELRYSLTVESPDGEELRFAAPTFFTQGAVIDVSDRMYAIIDSTARNILDRLEIGDYVFKINVHETGQPETGDVYTFNITFVPVVTGLSVSAGGKNMPVTPQLDSSNHAHLFIREFETISTGETEIALKGTLRPEGAKFVYNDADKTADFKSGGVTIDLSQYEKDENNIYTIPFSIVHDASENTRSDYTLYVTAGAAAGWEITGQPQGGTYDKGDSAVLSVETDAGDGDVTYQWQYTVYQKFNNIPGATEPSFKAPTEIGGTREYRCVVTDANTAAYVNSDIAEVIVNLGEVNKPVIVYQPGIYNITLPLNLTPYKTEYLQGEPINPIQASVGITEGSHVSSSPVRYEVEWYYNTQASTQGAVLLDRANYSGGGAYSVLIGNVASKISCDVHYYVPPEPLPVGEHYFYFVATAISNADEANRASDTSEFAKITVSERTGLEGFEGKGTDDDPYLIKTVEHFEKIRDIVMSGDFLGGAVFKLDNDVTLPVDWEPIGKGGHQRGIDLLAFSGIIDGADHTLTVAKGGKPLLNYTRDAVVKNLNIYGEEINGAGLLDKVIIDYGTDGVYQQHTDPDVITMENVTLLSGSKTLGSGLANGGPNSGINDFFIKNCTIEEGVVVGYNKDKIGIGSFVGTFNGRIENSVSYATVYGNTFVGGLVGNKAQSMGDCEIVNSAFLGTIEATGGRVGGIIGAGYISSTAPNTPPITVRNCYVVADITGDTTPKFEIAGYDLGSGIGGIAGSEIGLRAAINYSYITDNHFYGTITDTNPDDSTRYDRVGGILGEVGKYVPAMLFYDNNYYLENDNYAGLGYLLRPNTNWKPGEASFVAKSSEDFADGTVFNLLTDGKYSFKNWMQEENAPYPVHDPNAQPRVYALEISGEFKDIYYVGEELDTTGMEVTALYTLTGDEVKVDLKDAVFSGYNPNIVGNQDVTVTYEGASATFAVSVIRSYDDDEDPKTDTISVKFALIGSTRSDGDIDLGNEDLLYRGASYETWVGLTEYEMAEGATVLELFDRALKQANIPYTIRSMNNYVDSINGLVEFTNGQRSGWMYTVGKSATGSDGNHPKLGLREYVLSDGDVIIWHYVNDFSYEVPDWFDDPEYPALGDGTYYSLWLKALASGSYTPPSGSGTGDTTDGGTAAITPETTVSNGKASASVDKAEIDKILAEANKDGTTNIKIDAKTTESVTKSSVTLPSGSASDMAKAGLSVSVETSTGNFDIDNDALKAIAAKGGGSVELSAERLGTDNLTDANKELVGDHPVFDLSITVGSSKITDFGDGAVTVSLPYTPADGEDTDNLTVYYIDADGNAVEMAGAHYDGKTGSIIFETDHFSTFAVVYEAALWTNPFTDVTTDDWFYKAVEFVASKELFSGVTETTFEPDTAMTRAMLVKVLYRLEGEPAVTADNLFTDVADDDWYTDAVIWASENKIVGGYGGGLFGTNDSITREQMATILYNYANYKGYDVTASADISAYTDADGISTWAESAMQWASAEELINGVTDTTLEPNGSATRAQVATIFMRFVENLVG